MNNLNKQFKKITLYLNNLDYYCNNSMLNLYSKHIYTNFKFSSTSKINNNRFTFYQRIFPSVRLLAEKLNVKIPSDVKYVSKELILSLSKDKTYLIENKKNNVKYNNYDNVLTSNNNIPNINTTNKNKTVVGNMQAQCYLNSLLENLNLLKYNEQLDNFELSKLKNFLKKSLITSLNKSNVEVKEDNVK